MTDTDFLMKNVFFTTREFAIHTGRSISHASHKLDRLRKEGTVTLMTRGVFAQPNHPFYTVFGAVPYLLGNEQGYISFLSALHRYGIISQIPTSIHVATTGHTRQLRTPLGSFEFFKLNPKLMRSGIENFKGKISYNIASQEKALFDTFYLSTRKGRRFTKLPELDLDKIKEKKFLELAKSIPITIRIPVLKRWEQIKRNPDSERRIE